MSAIVPSKKRKLVNEYYRKFINLINKGNLFRKKYIESGWIFVLNNDTT